MTGVKYRAKSEELETFSTVHLTDRASDGVVAVVDELGVEAVNARVFYKNDRRNSGGTLRQKETKNALKIEHHRVPQNIIDYHRTS